MGRFLSQDTYPVNFGNPIELNRYVYAANRPINLSDPSGKAALAEYSILIGTVGGGVAGGLQTYMCGGSTADIIENAAWGTLLGFGFGVGATINLLVTSAVGLGLSAAGAVSSYRDHLIHGWNKCNGVGFAMSMLGVAFSAGGLAKGGIDYYNSNLRGLGEIGYYDEMLNPSMGHDGYYTGEYQPITMKYGPGFTLEELGFIDNSFANPEEVAACHYASLCGVTNGNPMYPDDTGNLMANPDFHLVGDLKAGMTQSALRPGDLLTYYDDMGRVVHSDRILSIENSNILVFDKPNLYAKYSTFRLSFVIDSLKPDNILVFRR